MASTKRKTEDNYRDLAKKQNIAWLGPFPKNVHAVSEWRCSQGHIWQAPYNKIREGYGCPYCAGNAPKSKQEYELLAKIRGLTWLGPYPPNTHTATFWKCPCGFEWSAPYKTIRRSSLCPKCNNRLPKQSQDYRDLASSRGLKWLGPLTSTHKKTKWECQYGHIFSSRYYDISRGHGCPYCAGLTRKTMSEYADLAKEHSLIWIGPKVENTASKTGWQCSTCDSIWQATYNTILRGRGCPYCANRVPITERGYHELAKLRSIEWIGIQLPKNSDTKTHWRCSFGHQWETSYHNIKATNGCPRCTGRFPRDEDDYHNLASSKSFEWIGEILPAATDVKTIWRCSLGHEWEARYSDIHHKNSGCPLCINRVNGFPVSKIQRQLHQMLGGVLNYRFNRRAIDIALEIDGVKIAVEYDCWYWHQGKGESDLRRDAYLLKHAWRILRIKSSNKLPVREQLDAAITLLLSGETYAEIILEDWKD